MSDASAKPMDVAGFLAFAEGREGKWELHDGQPVCMTPEQAHHSRAKHFVGVALDAALKRNGAQCAIYADGLVVRITRRKAFVPDVMVTCLPVPNKALDTSSPLIVVEVLSPSTAAFDHGAKLEGYFGLLSLAHYLVGDPDRNVLIQHSRGREGVIETRILREGEVRLDPSGLVFNVAELFG